MGGHGAEEVQRQRSSKQVRRLYLRYNTVNRACCSGESVGTGPILRVERTPVAILISGLRNTSTSTIPGRCVSVERRTPHPTRGLACPQCLSTTPSLLPSGYYLGTRGTRGTLALQHALEGRTPLNLLALASSNITLRAALSCNHVGHLCPAGYRLRQPSPTLSAKHPC